MNAQGRMVWVLLVASLVMSCTSTPPTTIFKEDFSGALATKWAVCPTSVAPMIDATTGIPAPGLAFPANSEAVTTSVFPAAQGLTIAWNLNVGNAGILAHHSGGLSSNLGCNGAAADTVLAGFAYTGGYGNTGTPNSVAFVFNGGSIGQIQAIPGTWLSLQLTISSDGHVSYTVNGTDEMQSSASILNHSGMLPLTFQAGNDGFVVDNVTVMTP